jgi:hypothetical protein
LNLLSSCLYFVRTIRGQTGGTLHYSEPTRKQYQNARVTSTLHSIPPFKPTVSSREWPARALPLFHSLYGFSTKQRHNSTELLFSFSSFSSFFPTMMVLFRWLFPCLSGCARCSCLSTMMCTVLYKAMCKGSPDGKLRKVRSFASAKLF